MQRVIKSGLYLTMFLMAFVFSGCNSTAERKVAVSEFEIYEVNHDGRIYVFYDRALYKEFLSLNETAYRLTRIGAGPNGQTMVFGLTKKDKKMKKEIPAISLYDDKKVKIDNFYAEMRNHGRIYVFSNWSDMKPVRQFGHPNYFYTEIGAGPKGETVVYVLNSKTKKKRPVELIKRFKKKNS